MTRLQYTSIPTVANWEENLYHETVPVVGGFVETDNPLTIESLLYRGFEIVVDEVQAEIEAEVDADVEIAAEAVVELEESVAPDAS